MHSGGGLDSEATFVHGVPSASSTQSSLIHWRASLQFTGSTLQRLVTSVMLRSTKLERFVDLKRFRRVWHWHSLFPSPPPPQQLVFQGNICTHPTKIITAIIITFCVRKIITLCAEVLLHFALSKILHFVVIVIIFCSDCYYIVRYYYLWRRMLLHFAAQQTFPRVSYHTVPVVFGYGCGDIFLLQRDGDVQYSLIVAVHQDFLLPHRQQARDHACVAICRGQVNGCVLIRGK